MTDTVGTNPTGDILAGVGGGLSILGSLYEGIGKSQQHKAQARMIENQIKESYTRSKQNIDLISKQHLQVLGRQQVATASQGKVGGRGSNYLLLEDTMTKMGDEIRNYSRDVAWQMYDMRYQAEGQKTMAKNAMTTAMIDSLNTAIKTANTLIENPDKPQEEKPVDPTLLAQEQMKFKQYRDTHTMSDKDFNIFKKNQTTIHKRKK